MAMAQNVKIYNLRLGDEFPDFECETTVDKGSFHDMIGNNWAIMFSHPADFTPVCTTEMAAVAKLQGEFDKRGVKLFGLSCNSVEDHNKWLKDIKCTFGNEVTFPLIADEKREIAIMLGMLDPVLKDKKGLPMTVRNVFVINPKKQVALMLIYPPSTGRNFNEVLRCVDSLQLKSQGIATPANWHKGDDIVLLPSVKEQEQKERFPNMTATLPYLRMHAQPAEDDQKLEI